MSSLPWPHPLRDAEDIADVPPHQVLRSDAVPQKVLPALLAVDIVAMAHQKRIQLAPISGGGLPETEHLHLEVGSLAAKQLLEGLENGQVESFGVHLDEAQPPNQVGVLASEEVLQVLPLHPELEGAAVLPLAHSLVKASVVIASFSVLELVDPVGPHRGEHQRHDTRLSWVEAGVPLQHREHVAVRLEREHEARGADRQRD